MSGRVVEGHHLLDLQASSSRPTCEEEEKEKKKKKKMMMIMIMIMMIQREPHAGRYTFVLQTSTCTE
jgi:hypothetical protein